MEEHVARPEASFGRIRRDLDEFRADQLEIRGDVKDLAKAVGGLRAEMARLPSTPQLCGIIASGSGVVLTVVILIVGGISVGPQYLAL